MLGVQGPRVVSLPLQPLTLGLTPPGGEEAFVDVQMKALDLLVSESSDAKTI